MVSLSDAGTTTGGLGDLKDKLLWTFRQRAMSAKAAEFARLFSFSVMLFFLFKCLVLLLGV